MPTRLAALALLSGPIAANAQTTTYMAFKGMVTGGENQYGVIEVQPNTPVTGVYAFGPASGVSFTADWSSANSFSLTATALGGIFETLGGGGYEGAYYPNAPPNDAKYEFQAQLCQYVGPYPGDCGYFANVLIASAAQPTWTSQGLPLIDPKGEPQGSFGQNLPGAEPYWSVYYRITSLQQITSPPIVVYLISNERSVTAGNPFLLTWSSTGTEVPTGTIGSCAASGGGASGSPWTGPLLAADQVNETTKVAGTFTYTVTCSVGSASASDSVTVQVNAPAPTPTPKSSGGGGSTSGWELAFFAAFGSLRLMRRRLRST